MSANPIAVNRAVLATVWLHASLWTAVLAVTCSLPLALRRRLSISSVGLATAFGAAIAVSPSMPC